MSIGEKVYQLRKKEGISQELLAESIGVSRQAISKWEQNVVTPDTVNLIRLCSYFDVSPEYFTDEDSSFKGVQRGTGRKDKTGLIILTIGLILIIGSVIMTYPMQVAEYAVYGESFSNPFSYLTAFPLGCLLAVGATLSTVGVYKLLRRRKQK